MAQPKMNNAYTLFPDFIALVPFGLMVGETPAITKFSDITKSNSFIINDASADTDLLLSEDGVTITPAKTSQEILGFDEGGQGAVDDVTVSRALTITIGVNGWSHDIWAIINGLDPSQDISKTFKFNKTDTVGVNAAGVMMQGKIRKDKYFFIARVPLEEGGDVYYCSPYVVVGDQENPIPMTPNKVTSTINLKGLKIVNSSHLTTLQNFSGAIANGYEMMFAWNADDDAIE